MEHAMGAVDDIGGVMGFTQTMAVRASDGEALAEMMTEWHEVEAGVAPGYLGSRLFAYRDDPGRFLILVDFSSVEEAEQNNDRPETQQWAGRLQQLIDGEPKFSNLDEIHRVG
jgi:quinol monooxygenase YgiN